MVEIDSLHSDGPGSPPFFIIGSGRSGSTLLRMMLVAHSRIAIPPETWFLLPLFEQVPIDRALNDDELKRAVALMTSHYRWLDMKIPAQELREEVDRIVSPRMKDVVEIVYRIYLKKVGKTRWGDKTPPYVRTVPQLSRLFPGARFIFLIRDGRDVAKSFQKLMAYGMTIRQNAIEWMEANRWERKWALSEYADSILHVRYEDLVLDPEPTLRRVCEFIGEQFEPQMLTWQEGVERMVPAREHFMHTKLTRNMKHDDIERWRREMTASELFVAEALMGRDLRRFGYAIHFRAPLWSPILVLTRVYCEYLLPISPVRALRVLGRLARKRPAALTDAVSSNGGAGESLTARETQAAGQRAVDPAKVRWRGFVR